MHTLLLSLFLAVAAADPAGSADSAAARDQAVDTVVVCPRLFQSALRPWIEYRMAQGRRIAIVGETASAEEIRAAIRRHAKGGSLRFVVLVGDADPAAATDRAVRARSIPTHLARAKINVHFGSEPEIATDNWYADLDDDALPDVAVGRLTADTPEELTRMIDKILHYERARSGGSWQRQLNFVAGVGGFGGLIDAAIETTTKRFLTDCIPAAYRTSMTYGSWQSAYCPDPRRFHETAVSRLNEGCLFWVYIGHGHPQRLDQVHTPAGGFHIFDTRDVPKLRSTSGAPIAVMLACYTGAFDQPEDCLAEAMLRADGGPIAVLSGSRVTMPYAMAVMGNELLEQHFHERRETLGETLLYAKRRMVDEPPADAPASPRQWFDLLARLLSPNSKQLREERAEHVLLFNLLGDPLLRIAHPEPVELHAEEDARAGDKIVVTGECPIGGRLTLELVCRRDRTRKPLAMREEFEVSGAALTAFDQSYNEANDPSYLKREFRFEGGRFRVELEVPADAFGPCHLCAEVQGETRYALGASDIYIRRTAAEAP